jgi:hypothetical protein
MITASSGRTPMPWTARENARSDRGGVSGRSRAAAAARTLTSSGPPADTGATEMRDWSRSGQGATVSEIAAWPRREQGHRTLSPIIPCGLATGSQVCWESRGARSSPLVKGGVHTPSAKARLAERRSRVAAEFIYANQNGKRFVVLTNGQNWRLYDNATQGVLADKLVRQVTLLDTPKITDFLTILSKQEVLQGSLDRMTLEESQRRLQEAHDLQEQQKREEELQRIGQRHLEIRSLLDTMLPALLNDTKSDLIALMAMSLNETEKLKDISPETLTVWFNERLRQPIVHREEEITKPHDTQRSSPFDAQQQGSVTWTLKELQGRSINGKKSRPVTLQAPDGTLVSVSN